MMIKKLKMAIFLWIQGWSGQLNGWAWDKRWKDKQSGTGYKK